MLSRFIVKAFPFKSYVLRFVSSPHNKTCMAGSREFILTADLNKMKLTLLSYRFPVTQIFLECVPMAVTA